MALFDKFMKNGRAAPEEAEALKIVDNLNNVLNTRRGYGSFLPDFGIRHLSEYRTRDDIALTVMREVKESIERYEPRVVVDDIELEDSNNPLLLSFRINCTIRTTSRSLRMVFDTVFGKFAVDRPEG
jgi:type VI secretion system lysozyme-like protein